MARNSAGDHARTQKLYGWDAPRREKWPRLVGVDEAGRGPMAGPVVAAAVILPPSPIIVGIDDSKKLTPKKRSALFEAILEVSVALGIGIRSSAFVDRKGIAQATYSAMRAAIRSLSSQGQEPDLILVDGYPIPDLTRPQEAVVMGDALSASIACASIIAKVTRDRIMASFHSLYPTYEFSRHKGYCTAQHRDLVGKAGPCPIHRASFYPISTYFLDDNPGGHDPPMDP